MRTLPYESFMCKLKRGDHFAESNTITAYAKQLILSPRGTVKGALRAVKEVVKLLSSLQEKNALSIDSKMTSKKQFEGLEWIQQKFSVVPRWTLEPDVEAVKRGVQAVFPSQEVSPIFLAQGAFNKLYNVQIGEEEIIMRVSLPVDPEFKTLSEVATVNWIRRNTSLPVPRILAYTISRDNPIGFEWILMSKVPGSPLADVWRRMTFPAKEEVVRQLATYSSCLFKKQLRGIGNIYSSSKSKAHDNDDDLPEVKRIVSMHFFWEDRISLDVPRGPFRSSGDWLDARLSCNESDCLSTLARCDGKDLDSDDEDDVEDARRILAIVRKLKNLLKSFFLSSEQDAEPSMLVHDDLSRHNILVDEAGALTGVIDWECVSALPLWKACDYPSFLQDKPRDDEPKKAAYRRYDEDDEEEEEEGSLYWEHMLQYELTMLRRYFLDEMRRLEPSWIKVFEASQRQRDFDLAAQQCDCEFSARSINEWIDAVTSGTENPSSLHERFYQ